MIDSARARTVGSSSATRTARGVDFCLGDFATGILLTDQTAVRGPVSNAKGWPSTLTTFGMVGAVICGWMFTLLGGGGATGFNIDTVQSAGNSRKRCDHPSDPLSCISLDGSLAGGA